ncbi:PHD finger protein At2g01810-like [Rutidosis leptorrhynchoides]|uniref:PHD finger protein At2g01810-like n=1 Tax=Rutidosis leptorrhynchoides TaxID=125765 RepID=UPI003A98E41F
MATLEACNQNNISKKRKQRIFEFKSFGKSLIAYSGAFRDNVRLFLDEFGERIDGKQSVWSTLLLCESNGAVFPIYIVEESIDDSSVRPFCFHCKSVGWGHHFVCKRRYRFLILPYGDKQSLKDYYDHKNNLELDDSLILHGLIHCNGFGHLISVNNLELASSVSLTQSDVMNLWDCICNSLRTRKVSVADVKLDKSMELRLLNGVAYKSSWFGNWGYKFGNGSFGVTEAKYRGAVEFLAELDLDKIIVDFKNSRHGRKIEVLVGKYRRLSETRLITLSDILQCLLEFKRAEEIERRILGRSRKLPKVEHLTFDDKSQNLKCFDEFLASLMKADCRWPEKQIEQLIVVIVKLLKKKMNVMPKHELKESAREYVRDIGLIDFVLKSISVLTYENYIIRSVVNSLTNVVEFQIHEMGKDSKKMKSVSSLCKLEPRWPKQRLEKTAKVIANILKEHKVFSNGRNRPMLRKDLRDMASKFVGDTGLIDFVLKSVDNLVVGKHIVTRRKNPITRLTEFDIRDKKGDEFSVEEEGDACGDLLFLYKNVLLGYPCWNSVSQAIRVVLNGKYFVKEWEFGVKSDNLMTVTCRVLPSFEELETELTRPLPPGEMVMVPPWMTIGKLREVAQCAFRDTYCIMDRFVVNQIGGLKGIRDEVVLSCAVEAGAQVWVRGCELDLDTGLRYEGGDGYAMESKVDCVCGAHVDDGERMVACDECHVWRHTKCSGIEDDEAAPDYFVCGGCDSKSKSELLSQ